jgi:hypothetical protein
MSDPISDLTAQGRWWIPGAESDVVQGILRADEDGATLDLSGTLPLKEHTPGDLVQGEVVLGRDERGRAITLLDASISTRHIGMTERSTVNASTVLVGQEHPGSDPVFQGCSFSLDGLAQWTETHFKLMSSVADMGSGAGDDPKRISFDVPAGRLTLSTAIGEHLSDIERIFKVHSWWFYESTTPKPLDALWREAIQPLRYLHMLFTTEPTNPHDVAVMLPSSPDTPPTDRRALTVHALWNRRQLDAKRRTWQWPASLSAVADRLPDVVNAWLDLIRMAEPALVLLFAVVGREKDLYLENRYLTLAQAAEAFHRHHERFVTRIMSEEDFAERLALLRNVAGPAGWWGDWLKIRIQYAYEPTFRQRLKDLVIAAGDLGAELFPPDIVDRVVNRRNELTHVLDSPDLPDKRYAEIAMLGEKLALLLTVCLFAELGFEEEEMRKAVRRNPHQRLVAEYRFE